MYQVGHTVSVILCWGKPFQSSFHIGLCSTEKESLGFAMGPSQESPVPCCGFMYPLLTFENESIILSQCHNARTSSREIKTEQKQNTKNNFHIWLVAILWSCFWVEFSFWHSCRPHRSHPTHRLSAPQWPACHFGLRLILWSFVMDPSGWRRKVWRWESFKAM